MRRRGPLGIGIGSWALGLGFFAVMLVATAPSTLLDASLDRATGGRLRMAEARGSLWSGTGRLEARTADGLGGIGENAAWRALPESLTRGRLVYDVQLARSPKGFRAEIGFASALITGAEVGLPAAVLGLAAPRLAPLELGGEILLRTDRLLIGRDGLEGKATVLWNDASSALTQVSPLGSYQLLVEAAGGGGEARLSTLRGPLELSGAGSWGKERQPALVATARMAPDTRAALAPLLRMIAVERPDGAFELQLLRYPISLPAAR